MSKMFAAVNSLYSTDQQYGRVIISFFLNYFKTTQFREEKIKAILDARRNHSCP
jgi:hypothetical protein